MQERLGEDPEQQRHCAGHAQRHAQAETGGQRRCSARDAFAHKHAAHDSEVIVNGDGDVQRRDDRQHVMPGLNQRQEDVVLAEEAGGRRDARQRQQEHQHQDRVRRVPVHETRNIVDVLAEDIGAAHRDDHQQRPERHERVDHQVDRDAFDARFVPGYQAQQHVPGMRDGAIGEQALDIRLADCGQVADGEAGTATSQSASAARLARAEASGPRKMRSRKAKEAAFEPTDRYAVTDVGAPS